MWFFAPTISQALSSSTKRAWKSIPSPEASNRRELLDFSRSEEHKVGERETLPVSDTPSSQRPRAPPPRDSSHHPPLPQGNTALLPLP